jgi:hypothetical protein
MTDPVTLLARLARASDRSICSRYYDQQVIDARPQLAARFRGSEAREVEGFRHRLHVHSYQAARFHPAFCGGRRPRHAGCRATTCSGPCGTSASPTSKSASTTRSPEWSRSRPRRRQAAPGAALPIRSVSVRCPAWPHTALPPFLCLVLAMTTAEMQIRYPETRKTDQADDYFGRKVADPYRWLEDDNSAETAAWVEAQNKVTFDYLAKIRPRESLKARLTTLWNFERYGVPSREGEFYIFARNDGLQNQSVVYRSKTLDAAPEVLIDPNTLSTDGTVALADTAFTDDGRLMAYALGQERIRLARMAGARGGDRQGPAGLPWSGRSSPAPPGSRTPASITAASTRRRPATSCRR